MGTITECIITGRNVEKNPGVPCITISQTMEHRKSRHPLRSGYKNWTTKSTCWSEVQQNLEVYEEERTVLVNKEKMNEDFDFWLALYIWPRDNSFSKLHPYCRSAVYYHGIYSFTYFSLLGKLIIFLFCCNFAWIAFKYKRLVWMALYIGCI